MGNRCQSCNKFVSLENGEPEWDDPQLDRDGTTFHISIGVRHPRTCAECSDELKEISDSLDHDVDLVQFTGWSDLTKEQQTYVIEWLDAGGEPTVSHDDGEVEESGGSRYKKNIITINGSVTLKLDVNDQPDVKEEDKVSVLSYTWDFTIQNAASNYEDNQ